MNTESKLDQILDRMASIDISVAKLEVNMTEHMRRTALNEKAIRWLYGSIIMLGAGALGSLFLFLLGHVKFT